jgi:hypothetical protein
VPVTQTIPKNLAIIFSLGVTRLYSGVPIIKMTMNEGFDEASAKLIVHSYRLHSASETMEGQRLVSSSHSQSTVLDLEGSKSSVSEKIALLPSNSTSK